MKKIAVLLVLIIVLTLFGLRMGYFTFGSLKRYFTASSKGAPTSQTTVIQTEESVITKVVEQTLPSVVTVSISTTRTSPGTMQFNPFNPFEPFEVQPGETRSIEQNIGSGFIVSEDGIIVTNKHVVSDTSATYKVITSDNKTYTAEKVFRDPLNDLAIVKIDAKGLKPLKLADSDRLKLGQIAIAFGTPLGEFRNTVTQGIISGLGRGITAGSAFEGSVERLDNVIQTDAAISPGNSGGPLVSSAGEVIGVNTAVSQEGQNIGFAIPSKVISDMVNNFVKSGGKISRPILGIRYKVIDRENAILNEVPEGAYVMEVVPESGAEKSGIEKGDIIVKIDGKQIGTDTDLAAIVREKNVGDKIRLQVWRDKKISEKEVTLTEAQ